MTNGQTEQLKTLVRSHFAAQNRGDLQTVVGNMLPTLVDHELEGDHRNDVQEGGERLKALTQNLQHLQVDIKDVFAEGDTVVLRAVWSGTDAGSGKRMGFRGFVEFRVAGGKFAERWATVTPLSEVTDAFAAW